MLTLKYSCIDMCKLQFHNTWYCLINDILDNGHAPDREQMLSLAIFVVCEGLICEKEDHLERSIKIELRRTREYAQYITWWLKTRTHYISDRLPQ